MNKNTTNVQRLVGTAVLAAVIIVLQTVASGIRIGPFTITLSLVPMIVGAIVYGPLTGAVLGAVFGIVVTLAVVSGADAGGAIMFAQNAFATVLICILKSSVAGLVAGCAAKVLEKKNLTAGILVAAIVAPICNTGIFVLGLTTFFHNLLVEWAAGSDAFVYILTGLVGVNFLVELLINIILVPVIVTIIRAVKKTLH